MNKPEFGFGDIVRVAGYYPRLFKVDGYREEHYYYPNEQWTEFVYELYDAHTSEWIEADEEDLALVAEADKAEEYLEANPQASTPITPDWIFGIDWAKEALPIAKQERKPTARELSAMEADRRKAERKERAEQVDNLLDLRIWASDMLEKTGNEEFGDRIFAIDCELKKLIEAD